MGTKRAERGPHRRRLDRRSLCMWRSVSIDLGWLKRSSRGLCPQFLRLVKLDSWFGTTLRAGPCTARKKPRRRMPAGLSWLGPWRFSERAVRLPVPWRSAWEWGDPHARRLLPNGPEAVRNAVVDLTSDKQPAPHLLQIGGDDGTKIVAAGSERTGHRVSKHLSVTLALGDGRELDSRALDRD